MVHDNVLYHSLLGGQARISFLSHLAEKPVIWQLARGIGRSEWLNECIALYPTIDIYEGQELAGGRTIGSTLKALGIGPHTPTRSSAIPLIGQKGLRPPLEPLSEGRSG
jgi:hypothetical protein